VLFTFLLGLAGSLHLPIPGAARALGILADLGSLLVLFRLVSRHAELKNPILQVAAPGAIYLFPLTLVYAVCGMETCPYIFLMLLLLERTLANAKTSWCLVAGLLMYFRPDSVVFIAVALGFMWMDSKRVPWSQGFAALGLGLSYLAFNFFYYHTLIPNTVITKSIAYHDTVAENFRFIAGRFFRSQILFGLFLALLAAAGIGWRKNRFMVLFALTSAAYTVFLLKAPHLRTWYVIPYLYVTLPLLSVAVAKLLDPIVPKLPKSTFPVATAVYLIAVGLGLYLMIGELHEAHRYEVATRRVPGEWLRTNTPPDARVFLTALEVGYFSKRYTMDTPGLVTPQIWQMLRTNGAMPWLEQAKVMHADFVLIPEGQPRHPAFAFIRTFNCEPPSRFSTMGYELFQRVKVPPAESSK
jgi:hypothetical protein